jgi:hypothetical protein
MTPYGRSTTALYLMRSCSVIFAALCCREALAMSLCVAAGERDPGRRRDTKE